MISTLLLISGYVLWGRMVQKNKPEQEIVKQLQIVNMVLILIFLLITGKDISRGDRSIFMIISDFIWLIGLEVFAMQFPVYWKSVGVKLVQWGKSHLGLLAMLVVCVCLAIYPTMLQFKWDGALYEQAVRRMDIHSMSSMAAYAHIAQGYGIIVCLFRMIYNDPQIAMVLSNLFLYVMSISAFYGIMEEIVPYEKKTGYLLATAVYAFSPLTLGMVNYYSLDYATVCLFICMLYFLVKKQWILQAIVAFFAVFTKEPAIVLYGGMCIGLVIHEWICDSGTMKERIGKTFSRTHYYGMVLTAILWFVTYKMLGGWNAGNSDVGVSGEYVVSKLLVMFLCNFTWIFVVVIVSAFLMEHKKGIFRQHWICSIFSGILIFTCFNCIFQTSNHMRYVAMVGVLLYVIALYAILRIKKQIAKNTFMSVLAFLLLISSFETIDPLTKLCFDQVDTGNAAMITTGIPVPGDSMIYNKQMLALEGALNDACREAVEQQYIIYLPTYQGITNLFDGLMGEFVQYDGYAVTEQYWDSQKNIRTIYEDELTEPFLLYHIQDEERFAQIITDEYVGKRCYLYADSIGQELAKQIQNEYDIVQSLEFTSSNWAIYMLVF